MNAPTAAVLAIRGLALWLFVGAVTAVPLFFEPRAQDDYTRGVHDVRVLVATLLPSFLAFVLWKNATALAARATSDLTDSPPQPWDTSQGVRAAIAVVGIVVLTQSIPEIAWYGSLFMSLNHRDSFLGSIPASADIRAHYWSIEGKANVAAAVGRLLVGLTCLLRPAAVARLVGRLDTKARAEEHDQTGDGESAEP